MLPSPALVKIDPQQVLTFRSTPGHSTKEPAAGHPAAGAVSPAYLKTQVHGSVGVGVGALDGASVGESVGGSVGALVGASVGESVGVGVGALVGASVGESVGGSVGSLVGAFVGEFVVEH